MKRSIQMIFLVKFSVEDKMSNGFIRNYAKFDADAKLPTSFITKVLGEIDIKEFVLHYGRAFRVLWSYMLTQPSTPEMKPYRKEYGMEKWVGLFDATVLFPKVEIVSTNPLEDKLRRYLNEHARISMRDEIEWNVMEWHGDGEPSTNDYHQLEYDPVDDIKQFDDDLETEDTSSDMDHINDPKYEEVYGHEIDDESDDFGSFPEPKLTYGYIKCRIHPLISTIKENATIVKLLRYIEMEMKLSPIANEMVPLNSAEDVFKCITNTISDEELTQWCEGNEIEPFKFIDIKEQMLPFLDGFIIYNERAYLDIKRRYQVILREGEDFPSDKSTYKRLYSIKQAPKDYYGVEEEDSNEGQFYILLELAMDYYDICKAFIRNEITIDDFKAKIVKVQADVEEKMEVYASEHSKKHFKDCLTPMATYNCLSDMCSKVIGFIESIEM